MTAVVHTDGDPADLFSPARERLRAVVPTVPGTLRTLDSVVAESFRDRSFTLGVLGAFAVLSLLLSAVGIYGVVSYTISSQAREIGILLALGAERGKVRAGMFFRSLRGVLVGIAVGIGVAVLAGGVLESLLFQVEPRDPVTLTLAPIVLLLAASVAIVVPVVKHTRIDPVNAMREE
jgi:ABC-type antimicrobial peptide transport system permease subunit